MAQHKFNIDSIRYFHAHYLSEALSAYTKKISRLDSMHILDAGCGTGEFSELIREILPNAKITGFDIDKKSISHFRNKARKNKINLYEADIENLPFKSNSFDVVLVIDVIEHVRRPKKAMLEIQRVLKHGGMFYLVVPCEADLYTIDGWIKKVFNLNLKLKPIGHINQFRRTDIKYLLRNTGFKIVNIKNSYYVLYQILSFMYYFYLYLFYKGNYFQLFDDPGKRGVRSKFVFLIKSGARMINLENSILHKLYGQTVHIYSIKK